MGMFDEVMVSYPNCHEIIELQSKAGDCVLHTYTLSNAPLEILADISKKNIACGNCSSIFRIRMQYAVVTEMVLIEED